MDYEKLLTNLGPLGLTFAAVIALGYVIRVIPTIQNNTLQPITTPLVIPKNSNLPEEFCCQMVP
jgi:hypothetical protein